MGNKFFVGVIGDDIAFMRQIPSRVSREDALNLAAWLVFLATDDLDEEWLPVLKEVQES